MYNGIAVRKGDGDDDDKKGLGIIDHVVMCLVPPYSSTAAGRLYAGAGAGAIVLNRWYLQ